MSKKTFVILLVLALLLIGGIAFAIFRLYSDEPETQEAVPSGRFEERHPLVQAVPSDAAVVFCAKDLARLREYLEDSTAIFSELVRGRLDPVLGLCGEYAKSPAFLSLNHVKDLQPLLSVSLGSHAKDTASLQALTDSASRAGLNACVHEGILLISSSQTILSSSVRHLDQGDSVLESKGFSALAGSVAGDDLLFLNNSYADVLSQAFVAKKQQAAARFLGKFSTWTAFSIDRNAAAETALTATLLHGEDPSYYATVLFHSGKGEISVPEALPAGTVYVFDLPVGDIDAYIKAWRRYLDAKTTLDRYRGTLAAQKTESGTQAEEWAKSLDIKEVALAGVHFGKDLKKVLLVRSGGRKAPDSAAGPFAFPGFVRTLFGELFTPDAEEACLTSGGWTVIGPSACIDAWAQEGFMARTLKMQLDESGKDSRIPQRGSQFFLYCNLTGDAAVIDATFQSATAKALRKTFTGIGYAPFFLSASTDGGRLTAALHLDRQIEAPAGQEGGTDFDTSVNVPSGPFPVTNCATGKTNKLYQNAHLSICLQDENGKDLWGIPFKERFAGTVADVDYFGNGKIQFLFGAGSKLYLLDRLGRFVGGFPVDLGKEIRLGPDAYDFTGAHGYTAVVLHTDNTVGMYDLHGKPSAGWKGFSVSETIKKLPELLEAGGKKYWIVRTSRQTLCFPFEGGESLWNNTGSKMIRPDSPIETGDGNSVKAKCLDGKERTFKLE